MGQTNTNVFSISLNFHIQTSITFILCSYGILFKSGGRTNSYVSCIILNVYCSILENKSFPERSETNQCLPERSEKPRKLLESFPCIYSNNYNFNIYYRILLYFGGRTNNYFLCSVLIFQCSISNINKYLPDHSETLRKCLP